MTSDADRILTAIQCEADAMGLLSGKRPPLDVVKRIMNEQCAIFRGEAMAAVAAKTPRKPVSIAKEAEEIYQIYPRKVGKEDALKAISVALKKHEASYLKDKTNQFRLAVESWPSSYRYFQDGGDRCPNPGTWYRQGRFADDPSTWRRHGAKLPAPNQKAFIPEPEGWALRFPDYVLKDRPWTTLPEADQRFISEAMKVGNVLAHPIQELNNELRLRNA